MAEFSFIIIYVCSKQQEECDDTPKNNLSCIYNCDSSCRSSDVELGASGAKALLIFNYLMPTCWLLLPLKTPQQLTKMFQPQQRAQQVPAGPKRQKLQKYANMFRNNMK